MLIALVAIAAGKWDGVYTEHLTVPYAPEELSIRTVLEKLDNDDVLDV